MIHALLDGFASMFGLAGKRSYAAVSGYFWKPCPMCGAMFSGADMDRGGTIWYDGDATWRKGMGTCPSCPGDWISPAAPEAMYRTNLDRTIPDTPRVPA